VISPFVTPQKKVIGDKTKTGFAGKTEGPLPSREATNDRKTGRSKKTEKTFYITLHVARGAEGKAVLKATYIWKIATT
jgi:hypothetical protein